MHYHRKPRWALSERVVTPEHMFLNRRAVLAGMGMGAAALALRPGSAQAALPGEAFPRPAERNPAFAAGEGRSLTPENPASTYNNFYEFASHKYISEQAQKLDTSAWRIAFDGLVENPFEIDAGELIDSIPVEERIYRHRCVEAWSMVVPWIGFPLRALLDKAKPLSSAKYVQFQTFGLEDLSRFGMATSAGGQSAAPTGGWLSKLLGSGEGKVNASDIAPGLRQSWYPWPYDEGLTMAEAANPLSFMVVGAYGKVLPKQFGAPMRLHVPWKYGFKSIKSVVRISFTEERPVSFWEEVNKAEYGFWANVNPEVDHPRWSQATERVLGTEDRIPTLPWNGYGEEVASLYAGKEAEYGNRLYR